MKFVTVPEWKYGKKFDSQVDILVPTKHTTIVNICHITHVTTFSDMYLKTDNGVRRLHDFDNFAKIFFSSGNVVYCMKSDFDQDVEPYLTK